ncbi:MAG: magnesium/cobalt transporter CorA [Deferrisomatales bacterium]
MTRSVTSRAAKAGLPPGSLVHVGERRAEVVSLTVTGYGPDRLEEWRPSSPEDVHGLLGRHPVTWIDVSGVHDVDLVARLGQALGLHPLVLEDVVNTHQRPKAEVYEGYLFLVTKALRFDPDSRELDMEQVSLILGRDFVLTFREGSADLMAPVRERIRNEQGRARRMGADYLAYALLDVVVDHYFLALDGFSGEIEDLEEILVTDPGPEALEAIHALRRVTVALRRAVWPLRDAVQSLLRSDSELIRPAVQPYLRDVADHAVQVIETVETYRDVLAGYLDVYLSSVSNRMNEVMKVLTMIATLFIPLSFLAGVYGMNFEYMPELKWKWGYFALWGVMLAVAAAMIGFFRRRRWF